MFWGKIYQVFKKINVLSDAQSTLWHVNMQEKQLFQSARARTHARMHARMHAHTHTHTHTHTHMHIRLMALCPGLRKWAGTRKVKPIWILLKQETVSGRQWHQLGHMQVCTLLQTDNHASTPPLIYVPPIQQCQSSKGSYFKASKENQNTDVNKEKHPLASSF